MSVLINGEKMASEGLRVVENQQESVESLTREVEMLKNRLEEERAKLNDVDCKYSDVARVDNSRPSNLSKL